jgi:hypothetical protein
VESTKERALTKLYVSPSLLVIFVPTSVCAGHLEEDDAGIAPGPVHTPGLTPGPIAGHAVAQFPEALSLVHPPQGGGHEQWIY